MRYTLTRMINFAFNNLFIYFRYPHGNYLGTLNFIWRAPDGDEGFNNEYYETLKAQMITRINETIPIYCTRQMRKNVFQKVCYNIICIIYFLIKN